MTGKQARALQALLTCPTQAAAAQAAGIGLTTLKRYLNDDEFQREYRKAVSGLVAEAATQAKQSLSPALSTLREVMQDTDQNAQARISAARSVLEYGLKLTEQSDILARLDELEAAIGGEQHGYQIH